MGRMVSFEMKYNPIIMFRRVFLFVAFLFITHNNWAYSSYRLLEKDDSFASQCKYENTIYDIRYDFNLNGASVTIPRGCVLKMNGGSINNGTLVLLSDTKIVGTGEKFNHLIVTIDGKKVENIHISGIELAGYKVNAKKKEDLITGIRVNLGASVNNMTVSNCVFHDFNVGISLRGSNIYVKDNLLYNNGNKGTDVQAHDGEIDIGAGYNATKNSSSNFIITGNRCLSRYVHRNIDCGELLAEDNIIISNNICVSMEGTDNEVTKDFYKAQCILLGYTGTSLRDKGAIISNNICRNCNWSAIYVRANNKEETAGTNGYVALITNNYIENVIKNQKSSFGAGIACELREGSLVANNIIKNCTEGINIGRVLSNGHVKIIGNSIDNCLTGIINDSAAKKIDISENSITNVSLKGISIAEASSVSQNSLEKYINISNNTITLKGTNPVITNVQSDENPAGIFLYSIGATSYSISSNFIHSNSASTNIGISLVCNTKDSFLTIDRNRISGCQFGIRKKADSESRNNRCRIIATVFENCNQALAIGANSKKQLFIVEDCRYDQCKSKFGDQSWARMVFDGKYNPDGSFVLFDDCSVNLNSSEYGLIKAAPICFFEKEFIVGDTIIPSNKIYFTSATCSKVPGKERTLWRFENASLPDSLLDACAIPGQIVFSTSSNQLRYYNNSWHNLEQ